MMAWALLSKILSFADTFKSPFWIFGATGQLQRALTLRFGGVRRQTWYLGTPTSSILSIFEVFMIPRLFWKIFFRGSKCFALFSKKVPPPELNFAEKISRRDFSKIRIFFSKRLKLRNIIWLKLIWFKYELLTPTEQKVRANRACHLLFVQGVVNLTNNSQNFPALRAESVGGFLLFWEISPKKAGVFLFEGGFILNTTVVVIVQ